MDARFIADVQASTDGRHWTCGTGYLVGPSLVLTSGHVIGDREHVRIRLGIRPQGNFVRCRVCWRGGQAGGGRREPDVALLRLDVPQEHPEVRWGEVFGPGARRYDALGYPDVAETRDHDREVKHLQDSLHPYEGAVNGILRLDVQWEYREQVDWGGFSGTSVFVGDLLVGVVFNHNKDIGALDACRVSRFVDDPAFRHLVEEDTGTRPRLARVDGPRSRRWAAATAMRPAKELARLARKRARKWAWRGSAHDARPPRPGTAAARRLDRKPVGLVVVVVTIVLGLAGSGPHRPVSGAFPAAGAECAPPTEVTVLTTPDQRAVVENATGAFADSRAEAEGGCVPVRVNVTVTGSAEARELLRSGWRDPALAVGPRPHVWLPDSAADIALLDHDPGSAPKLVEEGPTRLTPMVLGLPESASDIPACSGTDPGGARSNLAVCATAAAEAGILLARPSPQAAISALIQTEALYSAHGDPGSVALDNDASAEAMRLTEARATSAGLDSEGNLGLLCALREVDAAPSTVGVLSTEYAISAYNEGADLGPGCGRTSEEDVPAEPLVPVYFEMSGLDHPFVRLDWGNDRVEHEVEAFGDWLTRQTSGAKEDLFHGYRTMEGVSLGGDGARSHMEVTHAGARPDPREWRRRLEGTLRLQELSRAPVEVLLAIDRSDSMEGPGTGGTRLETAQELARSTVGLLGEEDTVGIWAFPENGPGNDTTGQERVLPPEPGMDGRREELALAEIGALTAELPATPLADAIRDGARELESCAERPGAPGACVLIVLTDGVALPEPRGGADTEEVSHALEALENHVRVHVVSVGNEGCGGDGLLSRMAEAGAECEQPRSDELDVVMRIIVSGVRAAAS